MPKTKDLDAQLDAADEDGKKAKKAEDKGDEEEVEMFSAGDSKAIKFDSSLVVGTQAFLKKWCPEYDSKKGMMFPKLPPTVRDYREIAALPVEDKWKMLGLSGMGAFDPLLDKDPAMPIYTQWVHDRMQSGKLSCITAGKEFTWGANLPASTIIVTNNFAESTSVSGMLQYVGRAARRGLTTHGQAIFEKDEDLNRIFSKGAQQMSTEADTMERYAKWILGGKEDSEWRVMGENIA